MRASIYTKAIIMTNVTVNTMAMAMGHNVVT